MLQTLDKFRRWVGFDRSIFYVVSGRGWSLLAGPITMYLITRFFTPETQGYFYTFSSLLAMQTFLELGFSQCLVQFASHEFAHLRFLPSGGLEGNPDAKSRLVSLGRLAMKWYAVLAVLFVICVGVSGHVFFSLKPSVGVSWEGAWWLLCVATGFNLALMPLASLLEGCNQISFLYGMRAFVAVCLSVVMWVALAGGAQLYCGVATAFGGFLITGGILAWQWRGLVGELRRPPQGPLVSWRHEIWPFQWKIAVSWISGYFIFNFFTPVLFYFHGPVVAGQMGMTLQLVGSLSAVAASWTSTKGPRFGMLVSQREYGELDRLFFTSTAQSVGVCLLGGVVLLAALAVVQKYFAFGARFLGPGPASLLVLATVLNQIVYSQALYLRAHKREPFMWLSVANGVLTGLAVAALGWSIGAWGTCLGYAIVQIVIFILATRVWAKCRRDWHQAAPATP